MNINFSGRHIELTEALKDHVRDELSKLEKHGLKVLDAEVVLDVEKHRHIAEIHVNADGLHAHSKEETGDLYSSIDTAVSKIEKQLDKKRQGRPRNGRVPSEPNLAEGVARGEEEMPEGGETVEVGQKVLRRESLPMKPMYVDEAVERFEMESVTFFPFVNGESGRVNVLYNRDDGTYGLIEPEY